MTGQVRERTNCRLCDAADLETVLSLLPTPAANAFVRDLAPPAADDAIPLQLDLCRRCGHIQSRFAPDPYALYGRGIDRHAASPTTMRRLGGLADDVITRLRPAEGALAVHVGANDGSLLALLEDAGRRTHAIEPAVDAATEASNRGISVFPGFLAPPIAARMVEERGPAFAVIATEGFGPALDPTQMIEGAKRLLAPDGALVLELPAAAALRDEAAFDLVSHRHPDYGAIGPVARALDAHGLTPFAARLLPTPDRRLRVFAQMPGGLFEDDGSVAAAEAADQASGLGTAVGWSRLQAQVDAIAGEARRRLRELAEAGSIIVGYGTTAAATTLAHQLGIDRFMMAAIIGDETWKQGLLTPGLRIPVIPAGELARLKPDWIVVLARDDAESIVERLTPMCASGTRFLLPFDPAEAV